MRSLCYGGYSSSSVLSAVDVPSSRPVLPPGFGTRARTFRFFVSMYYVAAAASHAVENGIHSRTLDGRLSVDDLGGGFGGGSLHRRMGRPVGGIIVSPTDEAPAADHSAQIRRRVLFRSVERTSVHVCWICRGPFLGGRRRLAPGSVRRQRPVRIRSVRRGRRGRTMGLDEGGARRSARAETRDGGVDHRRYGRGHGRLGPPNPRDRGRHSRRRGFARPRHPGVDPRWHPYNSRWPDESPRFGHR